MSKSKCLYLLAIIFLLGITPVSADCTDEEIARFKKVESSYKITYEFDKETQKYNILLTASPSEYKNFNYKIYSSNLLNCITGENEMICTGATPGNYQFEIVGTSETCNDTLKTIDFKLEKYNKYSEDPLCEGYEEFYLCQTTYDKEVDYDTFVSRISTYRKNHEKQEKVVEEPEEENKINEYTSKIIEYVKNNLLSIIVVIVFVTLVIITIVVMIKSSRKSRRLE